MELFAITCTTCQARLKVRDQAAIGQILACPKCESMVQVTPPPGWQPIADPPPVEAAGIAVSTSVGHETFSSGTTIRVPAPQLAPGAAPTALTAPQIVAPPIATTAPVARRSCLTAWMSGAARHVANNWLIWTCSPVAAMAIALVAWIALRPGPVDYVPQPASEGDLVAVATTDDAVPADPPADIQSSEQESGSRLASSPVAGPTAAAAEAPAEPVGERSIADDANDDPTVEAVADSRGEPGEGDMADEGIAASDQPTAADGDAPFEEAPARPAAVPPAAPRTRSPVDVQARLADPLPRVDFQRMELADFCDFLAEIAGVPITLDVDALTAAGIRPSDPLTVRVSDATVGDVLTAALAQRQLTFVVVGQHIIVTSSALRSEEQVTETYDIRDLAGASAEEAAHLAGLATRFVRPERWQDRGGKGRIAVADGQLLVEQTPLVQRQVAALLDALRAARGVTAKGTTRDATPLATRYSQAKATLDKHVTANFSLATPLAEILSWLGRSTGTRFLIDARSLAHAGLARDVPTTFVAADQSLQQALAALLDPLACSFRVIDERTLQVYARSGEAADPREIELYPVADLLGRGLDAKRLVAHVRATVDPKSWVDAGGAGDIEFDARGKCLVVRQSPSAHLSLEKVLSGLRQTGAKGRG